MLNFTRAEYVGEVRGGSVPPAVGSLVRGCTETFLYGLVDQQSSSDLSLHQFMVHMPLPVILGSDFPYLAVSVLKDINSFAALQL